MSDDTPAVPFTDPAPVAPAGGIICPWCSTVAPEGAERCASCGAVPGLTALDTEGLLRAQSLSRQRSTRILPFRLGTTADGNKIEVPSEAELQSLAPPTSEVQLEIVRLELDAERQRLESARAELESEAAEAARDADASRQTSGAAPADSTPSAEPPLGPETIIAATPPPGPGAAVPESDQPAG